MDPEIVWLWYFGAGDAQRRGHAYITLEDSVSVEILEHSAKRTPKMVARLNAWVAAGGERKNVRWRDPAGIWAFTGDLGAVQLALLGRELTVHGKGPHSLPEGFLRNPVRSIVEAALGAVSWPPEWNASTVCFGPRGLVFGRDKNRIVLSAARPGSAYARSGQDRTAAVFSSEDGGGSWVEHPWNLSEESKTSCWPPEEIDRLRLKGADIEAEWEDPWFDFDPGEAWLGVRRADTNEWSVSVKR